MPEVQCTKFCTLRFKTYPDVVYKVATAAILIQTRGVQSVFSLEKDDNASHIKAHNGLLLQTQLLSSIFITMTAS